MLHPPLMLLFLLLPTPQQGTSIDPGLCYFCLEIISFGVPLDVLHPSLAVLLGAHHYGLPQQAFLPLASQLSLAIGRPEWEDLEGERAVMLPGVDCLTPSMPGCSWLFLSALPLLDSLHTLIVLSLTS